jgi:hypothetical protein
MRLIPALPECVCGNGYIIQYEYKYIGYHSGPACRDWPGGPVTREEGIIHDNRVEEPCGFFSFLISDTNLQ